MTYRSPYFQTIRESLATMGHLGTDPRHVEAFMRLEHPTLDGLSSHRFRAEIAVAVACIAEGGTDNAEACAQSFGL